MSKICKIMLSADVFTTKQNLAKHSTVLCCKFCFSLSSCTGCACDKNDEPISKRRGKTIQRTESWRYEANMYVNPNQATRRARMTTHQLPYQLVPTPQHSQDHIASYLGRSTQVKFKILSMLSAKL